MIQYNSSGTQQWAQFYNGAGTGDDDLNDMKVDAAGNTYVTGSSDLDSTITDNLNYATIKYSTTGNKDWIKTYNGAANGDDAAFGISLNTNGEIYVTGQSDEGSVNIKKNDATTVIYSSTGTEINHVSFDGPINGTDAGEATYFYNGSVYLCGYGTYTATDQKDFLTIKYDLTVGINETESDLQLNVYPNPARDWFIVHSSQFTENSNAELTVSDITGRKILTTKPISTDCLLPTANWLPGIYFLRVQYGNRFTETKIVVQ